MKSHCFVFTALSFLALATGLCAQSPAQPKPKKIGVMLHTLTSSFDLQFKKVLEEEAAQRGFTVIVRAPVNVQSKDERLSLLQSMENGDFDLVMFAPRIGYHDVFVPAANRLKARSIKVMTLLEPLENTTIPHVGMDEGSHVNLALEKSATLVGDDDEVGMLRSNTSDGKLGPKEIKFIQGLRKIHPKQSFHIDRFVSPNGDAKFDAAQARAMVEAFPNLKLIYSAYTQTSLAAINGVRDAGKAGKIHLVCIGSSIPPEAVRAIEDGTVDAWIAILPDLVAKKAIEVATNLLADKPVPAFSYGNAAVITKENLHGPETAVMLPNH
jgi:ribose transport system substrate-binding protein